MNKQEDNCTRKMKFNLYLLSTFITISFAASIPAEVSEEFDLIQELGLNSNETEALQFGEVSATGFFDFFNKGKKALSMVNVLKDVLSTIGQISMMQSDVDLQHEKRGDLVEDLLVKVFVALKKSGLVNSIVKMALTDCDVRPAIIDITIQLIEADVIPYEEIFVALKDSGLATDVIEHLFTDPETREGLVAFTTELIPELLESGALSGKDFCIVPSAHLQLVNASVENRI